jgi:hypothetical protein
MNLGEHYNGNNNSEPAPENIIVHKNTIQTYIHAALNGS